MSALKYLKEREWSMGNGQCPDCYGVHEGWYGESYLDTKSIGHKKDCSLAASLLDLGGSPLFKGDYKSDKEYESFISEGGFLGTREKTENGCPRYEAWCEKANKPIRDALNAAFDKFMDDNAGLLGEIEGDK